jgi:cadmium resistance protein CadD (predicted permease)
MAEAGIAIFIATAVALAIVTAIQFAERAYRYKRINMGLHAGTYGFTYESSKRERSENVRDNPQEDKQ